MLLGWCVRNLSTLKYTTDRANGIRVSATNCAQIYDLALSQRQESDIKNGGWEFGMKLQTEHVWDAFVLWSLIQQHEVRNDIVKVPHTGDQKHRFTKLMKERNQFMIDNGQDEVAHYCDKCMRTWEDDDGTIREYFCHAESLIFFWNLPCTRQMPDYCIRWHHAWTSLLWGVSLHDTPCEQPGSFLPNTLCTTQHMRCRRL